MPAKLIPAGTVFGKLKVICPAESVRFKSGQIQARTLCSCICGREIIAQNGNLRSGRSKSCGCVAAKKASNRLFIHGHSRVGKVSGPYGIWLAIKQRCYNKNFKKYADYGGRGITMCDEWRKSYPAFYEHVGDRPEGLELGRINNNLGYEPGNVRWETRTQQMRNTRTNRIITVLGITASLAELCEQFNVSYSRTADRLRRGWGKESAFFSPKRTNKYK